MPDEYRDVRNVPKARQTYNTGCVMELLRFIRNAYSHKSSQNSMMQTKLNENIFLKLCDTLVLDVFLALERDNFLERPGIKNILCREIVQIHLPEEEEA